MTFRLIASCCLAAGALLLGACASRGSAPAQAAALPAPSGGFISSEEAHQLVEQQGGALIDVRTPEEFAQGHVEGARNIPVQEIANRLTDVGDPEKPVVLYCRSGRRAAKAQEILEQAGFKKVANLGGMSAWYGAAPPPPDSSHGK